MELREIDAQIAEKAMGWKTVEGDAVVAMRIWHTKKIWIDERDAMVACLECGNLPAFSSDPAEAKKVRLKLAERFLVELHYDPRSGRPEVFIRVYRQERGYERCETLACESAATEELATCLAALKAIETMEERNPRKA
jgi:hypothetical protein